MLAPADAEAAQKSPSLREKERRVVSIFTTIGVGIALFAATNVDDIFVLLAFFTDARFRPRQIVRGRWAL